MVNYSKLSFYIILSIFLSSCTAPKELSKYPRTHIDRPYTIPKGVAALKAVGLTTYDKSDKDLTIIPPVPLVHQYAFTDNINLELFLIFPKMHFQLFKNDNHTVGLSTGFNAFAYNDSSGGIFILDATGFYRYKFFDSFAIEASTSFVPVFRTKKNHRFGVLTTVAPVFQLADTIALKPYIQFQNYQPSIIDTSSYEVLIGDILFPIGLWFQWSFHARWDTTLEYTFVGINQRSNEQVHQVKYFISFYW